MDSRLWKFSDAQLAMMMGSLNDGRVGMKNRLLCEISYRLMRAGGPAMTEDEEDLIDALMTHEFRLRENRRKHRRSQRKILGGDRAAARGATPKRVASVRPIR
jgi:hypothetical protein